MTQKTRLMMFVCFLLGSAGAYGCGDSTISASDGNGNGTSDKIQCEPACEGKYTCDTTVGECVCPEGEDCTSDEPENPGLKECVPACTGKYMCDQKKGECVCPTGQNCEEGPTEDPGDEPEVPDEPVECGDPDQDGDGVSDEMEGCNKDADGDGTPNCQDDDSDGDGIPDWVESGTNRCSGKKPVDTDVDTIPDYLDTDSDGNTILDNIEAGSDPQTPVDTDGNGKPDYIDLDNDGDGLYDVQEIVGLKNRLDTELPPDSISADCDGDGNYDAVGTKETPINCDGDTTPDYMDTDSDNDGMLDAVESMVIGSKYYARYSTDSDSDGIPDNEEGTEDTDNDTIPDYLDIDSDSDGLKDAQEKELGTNPKNGDTDGDEVTDLVEFGAETDPLDPASNPMAEGNFVFVVPYMAETTPKKQTMSLETAIQTLDLYFSFDNTGSMKEEQETMVKKLPEILTTLQCQDYEFECESNVDCLNESVRLGMNDPETGEPNNQELSDKLKTSICSEAGRCIQNPKEGDGCFADMYTGFGYWNVVDTYSNQVPLQADVNVTTKALDEMPLDTLSSGLEAPYQPAACAADSDICYRNENLNCDESAGRVGCAGFRRNAIKVYIQVTDANEQCCVDNSNPDWARFEQYYCTSLQQCSEFSGGTLAGNALKEKNIRFISLYGDSDTEHVTAGDTSTPESVARALGIASGSVNAEGEPFVYEAKDTAVKEKTIEGVRELAKGMDLVITSDAIDITANASKLIKGLEINVTAGEVQGRTCTVIDEANIDKTRRFHGVKQLPPGTSICYDVIPVDRQSIFKATEEVQLLKARIRVLGDGSVLNSGVAYFLIPPVFEQGDLVN